MICSRLFTAAMIVCLGSAAQAQVLNVWWEPTSQTANLGDTITVSVFANSNGPSDLALSDAYLAITWDNSILNNVTPATVSEPAPWVTSYWSPGAPINSSVVDGDAQRELLGELPPNYPVAPVGIMHDPLNRIKVTSFNFQVVSLGSASIKLWNSTGGATTNFLKGNFQIGQWDLAFDQGNYSEAIVNAVPEPASMAALGLGIAALIRRRKRA